MRQLPRRLPFAEKVLLSNRPFVQLQENTVERHLFLETAIEAHYGEFSQLKAQVELQMESISKQGRRRSEALHGEFRNDIEALKESIVTRAEVGRIMDWVRQDLLATISDRNNAESIQNSLHNRTANHRSERDRSYISDCPADFAVKIGGDDGQSNLSFDCHLTGGMCPIGTQDFTAVGGDYYDAEHPEEAHAEVNSESARAEQINVLNSGTGSLDPALSDENAAMDSLSSPVEEPDYLSAFEDDFHEVQALITDVCQPGSEAVQASASLRIVPEVVEADKVPKPENNLSTSCK